MCAAHMLGASFAAYGAGYSRSVLQTYLPAFYAAGAQCLVAASLVWLIERRRAPSSLSSRGVKWRQAPSSLVKFCQALSRLSLTRL
jgi:hypothetical protein